MLVLKFGGTSVGSPSAMKNVASILKSCQEQKIVVLSAISGTTNVLVQICTLLQSGKREEAILKINTLKTEYHTFISDLFENSKDAQEVVKQINQHFEMLISIINDGYLNKDETIILAQGELMSTHIFNAFMESTQQNSVLIPALEFMRIDKDLEPDMFYIQNNLNRLLNATGVSTIITQGFICRNAFGDVDNLKRGGSDYSATLIGKAIGADRIEIWTDIDGMHNNDPRCIENTQSIKELHYDEASELAYFGAKILHPSCVYPAQTANIPLWLKNTMNPKAKGTIISDRSDEQAFKAIAAKDHITAIKIKSGRMLNAYGFLRSVFEVFERYKTPIDMITTSEVAVSLSIDSDLYLKEITEELEQFGEVEVDENQTIICVVGDFSMEKTARANQVFSALQNIPIRMISYGGSKRNISILVNSSCKIKALQALHINCFN
ncbi:MAG: aspartate kinase [Flavobacteriales bacterium]